MDLEFVHQAPYPWQPASEPPIGREPVLQSELHIGDPRSAILGNDLEGRTWRDPLCLWDVDPNTFAHTNKRIVCDGREQGFPFAQPGFDMSKLSPHEGDRQIVVFRAITLRQTAQPAKGPEVTAAEHEAAGVYSAEIRYAEEQPPEWEFSPS